MSARDHLPLLTALALCLLAPPVAAQAPPTGGTGGTTMPSVPGADAYDIRYYLTDENGDRLLPMGTQHINQFVNKARCQCGQQIQAQIRLKTVTGNYNTTTQVQTFVGTMCGTAEMNPLGGQFRKCIMLAAQSVQLYVQGIVANFHPVWLSNGIDASVSDNRDPESAVSFGSCESPVTGESGVWMCAQTNTVAGCQTDEFFITGTQNNALAKGTTGGIKFDFQPPLTIPTGLHGNPGDEAVVVSWDLLAQGDINGFRVLCEEADTGKPGKVDVLTPPSLTAIPNGTVYFTKDNLCPNGPFSLYTPGPSAMDAADTDGDTSSDTLGTTTTTTTSDTLDDTATATGGTTSGLIPLFEATTGTGSTTADSTTTDGTTTGTSTDSASTDGTTAGSICGNLMIEGDEECDDGPQNGDDKPCLAETCKLNVCGDGKQGPKEECDEGEDANAADALCNTDCTLNISKGLKDLDWDYVCTGHLPYNTKSTRIEGLENGKRYNFLLVTYDAFGNPRAFGKLVSATPVETYDLWDQCHALGDVCGKSGFCNVAGDGDPLLGVGGLLGLGLGLFGLRRRNRNRQRTRA